MMKKIVTTLMIAGTLVSTSAVANPDGQAAFTALGCTACHGNNGIGTAPTYPNLAGQKVAYTVKQLKDYQSGARKDPTMSAMAPLVAGKEQAIAEWLASLK